MLAKNRNSQGNKTSITHIQNESHKKVHLAYTSSVRLSKAISCDDLDCRRLYMTLLLEWTRNQLSLHKSATGIKATRCGSWPCAGPDTCTFPALRFTSARYNQQANDLTDFTRLFALTCQSQVIYIRNAITGHTCCSGPWVKFCVYVGFLWIHACVWETKYNLFRPTQGFHIWDYFYFSCSQSDHVTRRMRSNSNRYSQNWGYYKSRTYNG